MNLTIIKTDEGFILEKSPAGIILSVGTKVNYEIQLNEIVVLNGKVDEIPAHTKGRVIEIAQPQCIDDRIFTVLFPDETCCNIGFQNIAHNLRLKLKEILQRIVEFADSSNGMPRYSDYYNESDRYRVALKKTDDSSEIGEAISYFEGLGKGTIGNTDVRGLLEDLRKKL